MTAKEKLAYRNGQFDAFARCLVAIDEIAENYPTDIFPEDGTSQDCKSAKMARVVCAQFRRKLDEAMEREDEVGA